MALQGNNLKNLIFNHVLNWDWLFKASLFEKLKKTINV